jgi:hypothetical protein
VTHLRSAHVDVVVSGPELLARLVDGVVDQLLVPVLDPQRREQRQHLLVARVPAAAAAGKERDRPSPHETTKSWPQIKGIATNDGWGGQPDHEGRTASHQLDHDST